jgi:hypothetical protein
MFDEHHERYPMAAENIPKAPTTINAKTISPTVI